METLNDKLIRLEKEILELKKLPDTHTSIDYKAIDSTIKKQIKETVTINFINDLYRGIK